MTEVLVECWFLGSVAHITDSDLMGLVFMVKMVGSTLLS